MIASNVASLGMPAESVVPPEILQTQSSNVVMARSITVEEYVRNYFSDIPVMVEIARCESRFRQHGISGEVLRGEENNLDLGVMQINQYYHGDDSKKLGFDITTLEGNTSYARYLFEKYGVSPWKPSKACWGRTVAYSEYKELAANK